MEIKLNDGWLVWSAYKLTAVLLGCVIQIFSSSSNAADGIQFTRADRADAASPSLLDASPPSEQPPKVRTAPAISRKQTDDIFGQTDLRAFFEHAPVACAALSGLFEFTNSGIVLVYPRAVSPQMGLTSKAVSGIGRVVTLDDPNFRIRLQVAITSSK